MTSEAELIARLRAAERENRILRGRLERSESHRRSLELLKERQETLLRQNIREIALATEAVVKANADLERRVEQRTQALSKSNLALTEARDAALAASRAKSVFLATMSHELRTPLNAIIGYGELLGELLRAGTIKKAAAANEMGMILEAAYHLHELIGDILDLSQIESGATELHIEQLPIRLFLRDLVQVYTPQAARQNNTMQLHLGELPRAFFSDRTKLRQVLQNLLSNAAKFTRGGEINVYANSSEAGVELRVCDSGIGIAADDFDTLFLPFTQLDGNPTRRFEGTGLGLTICRSYCHLLGGEIKVESEPGVGSTFTVQLPWCPPKPPPLCESENPLVVPENAGPVLILDDDPAGRAMLEEFFGGLGITTQPASDLEQAATHLGTVPPRVVILEVLNHRRDGLQILERLAKDVPTHCPIIVLSQFDEVDRCRRLGAAACLRKPAAPDKLLTAITTHLA